MSERLRGIAAAVALAALVAGPGGAAENPDEGDLREFRVGMTVDQLPTEGYIDLACGNNGGEPGTALTGWSGFATCPAEPSGLHEVTFKYDDSLQPWAKVNDVWEGTKVAGHPVIPSLLIDDQGVLQGIRIVTDPNARMYLRKKAFLLGIRVMGRYGRDGWTCTDAAPGDRSPVGGMLIDRRCEKIFHDRRLILETNLYRAPGQEGREFTDATRLEIFKAG